MRRLPVAILAVLLAGCCDECEDPGCPDTTPPAAVTDLHVAAGTDSSATLVWTAPGDDTDRGTAAQYDLRYSTAPYTNVEWWDSLTIAVAEAPMPREAGLMDSCVIAGLIPATTYHFALKTADEVPNWSALSSVAGYTLGAPILEAQPESLSFGAADSELVLTLTNGGIGTLEWALTADQAWIGFAPTSGTTMTEEDTIRVTVDRAGLIAGTYTGSVTATPTIGEAQEIMIAMTVLTIEEDGMVLVPAGTFTMGDGVALCGQDERLVTLTHDFYLGGHEVTNQEYLNALQWAYDQGHVTVAQWPSGDHYVRDELGTDGQMLLDLASEYSEIQFDPSGFFYLRESPSQQAQSAYPAGYDAADHPVKMVSWFGAAAYCDWLSLQAGLPRAYAQTGAPYTAEGYRLPTDAEWEYAARYEDERIYPWGPEEPDCTRANAGCLAWTTPVGSYAEAPEALRLADMLGNVWEWCHDLWSCELGVAPVIDPAGPEAGSHSVCRGGAWGTEGSSLRLATRGNGQSTAGYGSVGFRIAKTIAP